MKTATWRMTEVVKIMESIMPFFWLWDETNPCHKTPRAPVFRQGAPANLRACAPDRAVGQFSPMAKLPYAGAGILFFCDSTADSGRHLLLGCRKRSGVWSIPGGEAHRGEQPWETALRETTGEFGEFPSGWERLSSVRFPFVLFDWTTFVVRLPETSAAYPDRTAKDFAREFGDAAWFPADSLPRKTRVLLHPVMMRLKASGITR